MITAYPQLILLAVSFLTLAGNLLFFIRIYKIASSFRDFEGRLRELDLDVADLTERFVNYQKREGMRVARDSKKGEADILAELKNAATAVPVPPTDHKAALRRKLRNMQ